MIEQARADGPPALPSGTPRRDLAQRDGDHLPPVRLPGGCRLRRCRLRRCRLRRCRLGGCRLGGCRLGGCRFGGCRFGGCRLRHRGAGGLDGRDRRIGRWAALVLSGVELAGRDGRGPGDELRIGRLRGGYRLPRGSGLPGRGGGRLRGLRHPAGGGWGLRLVRDLGRGRGGLPGRSFGGLRGLSGRPRRRWRRRLGRLSRIRRGGLLGQGRLLSRGRLFGRRCPLSRSRGTGRADCLGPDRRLGLVHRGLRLARLRRLGLDHPLGRRAGRRRRLLRGRCLLRRGAARRLCRPGGGRAAGPLRGTLDSRSGGGRTRPLVRAHRPDSRIGGVPRLAERRIAGGPDLIGSIVAAGPGVSGTGTTYGPRATRCVVAGPHGTGGVLAGRPGGRRGWRRGGRRGGAGPGRVGRLEEHGGGGPGPPGAGRRRPLRWHRVRRGLGCRGRSEGRLGGAAPPGVGGGLATGRIARRLLLHIDGA
ncbi:pentapeptide repeat-containing protein [Micromonospora sp. NPDC049836]|uniref:pentapeptide repeat-containing protein n=1 Tax=Micromonospora sp. NPDC049836 TaxID=3364274 RepID=UPI0037A7E99B